MGTAVGGSEKNQDRDPFGRRDTVKEAKKAKAALNGHAVPCS